MPRTIVEKTFLSPQTIRRPPALAVLLGIAVFVIWPSFASADAPPGAAPGREKEHQYTPQPPTLSEQIAALSREVTKLKEKVSQQDDDTLAMKNNGDARRSQRSMGTLGNASQTLPPQPMAPVAGNTPAESGGMMAGMMSMMNSMMGGGGMGGATTNAPMGQGAGMGPSTALSALPGFPGASHLYHIGSTNFFLDHPQHISLSLEQQSFLADLRTKSLLRRSEFNRKNQEVEEQLWLLTSSDQPNLSSIEAKITESEKLQGDFRISFIKDVGEAAKSLTDGQRTALLGQPSTPAQVTAVSTMPTNTPGSMGGM